MTTKDKTKKDNLGSRLTLRSMPSVRRDQGPSPAGPGAVPGEDAAAGPGTQTSSEAGAAAGGQPLGAEERQ